MSDEIIEQKYTVAAPSRLILSNVRGSVIIQPGEADVIEVKAVKHGNFDNGRMAVEMTQDSDGTVRVETRSNDAFFGFLSHPPRVDYSVRVPQGIHLEVSCVSSSLNVSELEGVFKLKTISGSVLLTKLTGPLKLGAVSGDITGTQLNGVLDLNTVSGNVHLTDSNFPSAEASTVSGDLHLQTEVAEGPYRFGSVSGSVRMIVPADTRCNVELNSVSGSIRSSLPATVSSMGHGLKVTQIQGGGTLVRLKSVSGGVSIETEGTVANTVTTTSPTEVTPVPPIAPVPPVPPAETISNPAEQLSTSEILQRIESGEMTVDEAIKLMKDQS
jgi:DUF4097 and DUF4098 domain-containing protein YvlB